MNMGKRIKLLLEERGWKQSELCERVPDMEPKVLSALIKRDSRFSEYALGIARAFGVPLDYLIFGASQPGQASNDVIVAPLGKASKVTTDEVCDLVQLYGSCDQSGRATILNVARAEAAESISDGRAADNRKRRT